MIVDITIKKEELEVSEHTDFYHDQLYDQDIEGGGGTLLSKISAIILKCIVITRRAQCGNHLFGEWIMEKGLG